MNRADALCLSKKTIISIVNLLYNKIARSESFANSQIFAVKGEPDGD